QNARLKGQENQGLRDRLTDLDTDSKQQALSLAALNESLQQERQSREQQEQDRVIDSKRYRSQRLRERMLFGFLAGITVWFLTDSIVNFLISKNIFPTKTQHFLGTIVRTVGTLIFCLPALFYIRSVSWRNQTRVLFFAFTVLLAFLVSRFIADETISKFASLIEVATTISGAAYLFITRGDENTEQ
ncbi:MAG: hypothetical protein ABR607_17030, partial [Pyrinomonadaceae bacterium]